MRQFKLSIDCVAALSMAASIVFGSLAQQVWPSRSYQIRYIEVSRVVGAFTKCSGGL